MVHKKQPEDRVAQPSCTAEGINYVIICLRCRRNGIRRQYHGESSRSAFQRGKEHYKEMEEGIATHPVVIHFMEEHQGRKQQTLFRIVSGHLTSLDHQTTESVNIIEVGKKPEEALNLKTE